MSSEPILIRELLPTELMPSLFSSFDRYQQVTRCWRKENGAWILKDIAFVEQWDDGDYRSLVQALLRTCRTGGTVLGAFRDGALVGFASVENEPFGTACRYLQLSFFYVSYECRRRGIGRLLFERAARTARGKGADALYLSAHSSEETQAFYRAMGCREAAEYNRSLAEKEPCDCQLEFRLS